MWSSIITNLCCPCSGTEFNLEPFEVGLPHNVDMTRRHATGEDEKNIWLQEGVLVCEDSRLIYPITQGVPLLLPYHTRLSQSVVERWPSEQRHRFKGYSLPSGEIPPGEQFVADSFSKEWSSYQYGDTLWSAPTADRLITFHGECGLQRGDLAGKRYCEIGCGLGITTNEANTEFGAEAYGIDLSSAAMKAAQHFASNPKVHFLQASVFALPFKARSFDFVFSHGVLHHTWSTKESVRQACKLVKDGGIAYIWLYSYDNINRSQIRKLAFMAEEVIRPVLARLPSAVSSAFLLPLIPFYQLASYIGRYSGAHVTVYSPGQALHAARDRFTPLYAHRHTVDELKAWYEEFGFGEFYRVTSDDVTESWAMAMDFNTAVRAKRIYSFQKDNENL